MHRLRLAAVAAVPHAYVEGDPNLLQVVGQQKHPPPHPDAVGQDERVVDRIPCSMDDLHAAAAAAEAVAAVQQQWDSASTAAAGHGHGLQQ